MSERVRTVLSIAGSDPSGGAGIQGDLKTFAALRVHGCAVITAITAQNTVGVEHVWPVPADVVTRQLATLFDDVEVHAVKVGMLGDAAIVRAVAGVLRRYPGVPIVLDPVLRASAGGTLLDPQAIGVLVDDLLPLVTLVTPNAAEAGVLAGVPAPSSHEDAARVARLLVSRGATAALVTGGHLDGSSTSVDVLATAHAIESFSVARIDGGGAHGTGCALSSAIAAFLARGHDLSVACAEAQRFVAEAIRYGRQLGVGHGVHPVHALGALWSAAIDHPSRATASPAMSDAPTPALTCPQCGHRELLTTPTDAWRSA